MNNQFDRVIINSKERPLSSDINTLQSQIDRSVREVMKSLFTARVGEGTSDLSGLPQSGFIGDGFKVRASAVPGMSVVLSKGQGFQYLVDPVSGFGGVSGVDDLSEYKPLVLLADGTISGIAAGDATNPRIDIVEVRMNRVSGNPLSRDVLDVTTGAFVPTSVNKTLSFSQDGSSGVVVSPANSTMALGYKQGVAGVTPVEPSVTPGYVKVATIRVAAAATTITKANISDMRVPLCADGLQRVSCRFTVPVAAGTPPTSVFQDLPPGMEMLVHKTLDPSNQLFTVWFVGGAQPVRGVAVGSVVLGAAGPPFYSAQVIDTGVGVMDAPTVAILASATMTSNAQTFALGTPYFFVSMQVDAAPASLTVDLLGTIKRY
jgi:hypothetical protein